MYFENNYLILNFKKFKHLFYGLMVIINRYSYSINKIIWYLQIILLILK